MTHFDVFNGDADGLCALQQLRLATPMEAVLVTGVKRDIALLNRVTAQAGDTVTVLDVSLERNRDALMRLLYRGVRVEYFDHHFAGSIPRSYGLRTYIDPQPDGCTSVIVDRHLQGRHRLWAVVGAFGDNLEHTAQGLAQQCGLDSARVASLRELGYAMNYNAYGRSEADLWMAPSRLYVCIQPYADPLDFIAHEATARWLSDGWHNDLAQARGVSAAFHVAAGTVHVLPDTPWARRVQGSFANDLAQREPQRAHAVLCSAERGDYVVSVRAPLVRPYGADRLCRRFPGGGGRAAAAGIDHLAHGRLHEWVDQFGKAFAA